MQHPRTKLNTQIYEEASAWFVESRAENLDELSRREFDAWLRKSPEHLSAYLEIAAIWNEGTAFTSTSKYDRQLLVAEALAEGNVVTLEGRGSPGPYETAGVVPPGSAADSDTSMPAAISAKSVRRWPYAFAAAAALAAVTMTAAWFVQRHDVYSTSTGEQRSLVLADGSTVELNTRSRIRVSFERAERHVALLDGEALFHVATDPTRPFIVSAGETKVRAIGTQFDVNKRATETVVTVLEGRVAVLTDDAGRSATVRQDPVIVSQTSPPPLGSGSAGPEPTFVSAGEQVTVTAQVARRIDHPNVSSATAWTQRQLVFEGATLSDVADEFNRYNERRLVIEDPDLYGFHISGVFSSTDPESLVRFLRDRPGVQVTETNSEIRVAKIFHNGR